nr:hypothetical protein [Pandoravirus aubagnensis]
MKKKKVCHSLLFFFYAQRREAKKERKRERLVGVLLRRRKPIAHSPPKKKGKKKRKQERGERSQRESWRSRCTYSSGPHLFSVFFSLKNIFPLFQSAAFGALRKKPFSFLFCSFFFGLGSENNTQEGEA